MSTAQAGTETGDHLIENQQRIELVAQLAQLTVKVRVYRPRTAFRTKRFHHDRRRATAQAIDLQATAQRIEVIRRALLGVRRGAAWNTDGLHTTGARQSHAIHQLVAPAVIRTADLDHHFLRV